MRQYSANLVKVHWIGLDLTEGLAAGTFIQPSRNAPIWTQKPDGYGGVIQLASLDTSGKLVLIMDQESKTHAILQGIASADRISRSAIGPLIIRDTSVGSVDFYNTARLEGTPDSSKGTGGASAAWTWLFSSVRNQVFNPDQNRIGS